MVQEIEKNLSNNSMQVELLVDSILDEFQIPKSRGYRVLRSIILHMYRNPSLSLTDAQSRVASESGLRPHNIRYAMDSVVKEISPSRAGIIGAEEGRIKTKAFVDYCICKLPGA